MKMIEGNYDVEEKLRCIKEIKMYRGNEGV